MTDAIQPDLSRRVYSDPDTEVVLHVGFICTDDEKLLWSLRRDKPLLEEKAIAVPRQKFFTGVLREFATRRLKGEPAGLADQEELFERLIGTTLVDRLVLSYDSFMSAPGRVCRDGGIYVNAADKARELRNLFPDCDVEFMCAVRNPATFLPALYRRVGPVVDFETFLGRVDLRTLRWSDVIQRMREGVPDAPITVWANEDTPFVWNEVLRRAAGLDPGHAMTGRFEVAREIMTDAGRSAFDAYVARRPDMEEDHAMKVIELFLSKFAAPDEVEESLDLPGIPPEGIEVLTTLYEEDLDRIAAIPGVELIVP